MQTKNQHKKYETTPSPMLRPSTLFKEKENKLRGSKKKGTSSPS